MQTRILYISLAVAMGLAACSQNEAEDIAPINKSNVISLTSSMETMRAASELQTNALSTSVKVGAFGVSGSATITNGNNNQYTVGTTGNLTATNEMAWPSDASAKVNIYAYAPYQSNWTYNSANAFSVQTDQSSDANYLASDLLYAKATDKTQTTEAIALNFAHKLSRINVKIEKGSEATVSLENAVISIMGTKTSTTLNPSTGAIGEASGSASEIKVATLSSDATATVYGIVIPQTLTAGENFVKIKTSTKTLVAKLSADATIESGKSYNYTATIGAGTSVVLTLGSVTLDNWTTGTDLGTSETEDYVPEPIYASFGTPGSNASYAAPTYTWTGSTSNLMNIFTFANGELADYKTLQYTFSDLVDGPVRIGYYVGSSFTEIGNGLYSASMKTVDLTSLGIDLSTVTAIAFGGRSNAGSCKIVADDVVLYNDNYLLATFGTPGGSAQYDAISHTYSWGASTNNLMNCFSFTGGELANYSKLNFNFTELAESASIRINLLYNDDSNNSKTYNTAGKVSVNISDLLSSGKTAADVKAIRFGGNSGNGSCVIKPLEMYLSK